MEEAYYIDDLCLRKPRMEDVDAIMEFAGDIDVVRYMDWVLEKDVVAVKARQRKRIEAWERGEGRFFAIARRETNRAIGSIAFEIENDGAEIGYILEKSEWGKGIATKCARLLIELLFRQEGIERVWATCDQENTASARVLKKAGMKLIKELPRFRVRPNISSDMRDAFLFQIERKRANDE
jgi:ribosomal-protein-alanine N-acetyltransferase